MLTIIGHRGARGLATENTLGSILKALACNVDEVEIDVRVTSDGVVVLHHDTYVQGKNNTRYPIATHTMKELRAAWPDLATLEEAIRTMDRHARLLVEIKPGVPIAPVVEVIQTFLQKGWRPRAFLVGSKSQKILRAVHHSLPQIEVVVIESWSGVRAGFRARQLNTKRVSMNHRVLWFGFIKAMASRGYRLSAYTLNDPRKATRLARFGLYGVITDHPERFHKSTSQ